MIDRVPGFSARWLLTQATELRPAVADQIAMSPQCWRNRVTFGTAERIPTRALVAALMLVLVPVMEGVSAQDQSGECRSCVALSPVVELSTSAGPILPSLIQSVLRMRDGRWLVSQLFKEPAQFAVYDPTGRLQGLHGTKGGGPGEFLGPPRLYPGPGNTVWAVDRQRLVRLDSALRHIDTKNVRQRIGAVHGFVLPNGRVAFDSKIPAAAGGIFTVSLMDTAGNLIQRLEHYPDVYSHTVIAAAPDGFWALSSNQLLLRKYSTTGRLIRSVRMVIDHFQPWQGQSPRQGVEGFDFPPRPVHHALLDVGNNQIVVFTRVADTEWKQTPSNRMFRPSAMDYDHQFDTLAALVDLRTGRMIGSTRIPEALLSVAGAPDLFFATREDSDGQVITRILRVQMRTPARD